MPRYGMVIDLSRCIGCRSCAVACKIVNSQPPGTWWQRVETVGAKEHQTAVGEYPNFSEVYLPVPCMHCENAPCVRVCPVNATFKREDGLVLIDFERCIGCRYCLTACPYGVRQFNWQDHVASFRQVFTKFGFDSDWFVVEDYKYGYPFIHKTKDGRIVYMKTRPRGVVEKCTFCVQFVDQGQVPACVAACPSNARVFGDLEDPNSQISRIVSERQVFRLLEHLGTEPKVFYIPPMKKAERGQVIYSQKLE